MNIAQQLALDLVTELTAPKITHNIETGKLTWPALEGATEYYVQRRDHPKDDWSAEVDTGGATETDAVPGYTRVVALYGDDEFGLGQFSVSSHIVYV